MSIDNDYLERTQRNHFWTKGIEGQIKISNLRVAIAGLGGMGSGIALALARLGVRHFNIADNDIIERSNMNRQVIANTQTLNHAKAIATKDMLLAIDPNIKINLFPEGVHADMCEQFLHDIDVVVDEIDVYPIEAHLVLHQECSKKNLVIYSSYVIGMGVHLYKFSGGDFGLKDFYHPDCFCEETKMNGIIQSYLRPTPDYLLNNNFDVYVDLIKSGRVPIFGPSCLFGHALVSTRLIMDYLGMGEAPTPVMPHYLSLDANSLKVEQHCFARWT